MWSFLGVFPETFPYSAPFGTTVDIVASVYGLCLATDTGTHSANCAQFWFLPVHTFSR